MLVRLAVGAGDWEALGSDETVVLVAGLLLLGSTVVGAGVIDPASSFCCAPIISSGHQVKVKVTTVSKPIVQRIFGGGDYCYPFFKKLIGK